MGLNMIALNVVLFEDGLIDFTPGLYGLFEWKFMTPQMAFFGGTLSHKNIYIIAPIVTHS
jgi:hypothetical protein